jgi:hypothetical protein
MPDEFKTGLRARKDDFANAYAAGKSAYQANSCGGWYVFVMAFALFVMAVGRRYQLPWYEILVAYVAAVVALRVVLKRVLRGYKT